MSTKPNQDSSKVFATALSRTTLEVIGEVLGCDPAEASRWRSEQVARKFSVADIGSLLAACGLAVVASADGVVCLSTEEHNALLLFAERGIRADK